MVNSGTGDYIGYNAETKILSAVSLLAGKADRPTAYYLQGHGEPTLAEATDWKEVLELGGFEVKEINLSNEECHNSVKPYFMANYATVEQVVNLENAYSWGEL
jgi:hypothetical protein